MRIRLFGQMEVEVGGEPIRRLRSKKGLWALALLALKAGRPVQRSWLAGALWPDSLDEQALANLRLTLSDLRGALGAESVRIQSPTPQTLSLDLEGADVDAAQFDRLVELDGSGPLAAIRLYRGPLLEGCSEEWVLQEREPRALRYLEALEQAAARESESGNPSAAAGFLRNLIGADPYRESAHRELMKRLAECGDHAAVTAAYRDLRTLLRDELNSEPSAETTALYHALRQTARERAAAPADHRIESDDSAKSDSALERTRESEALNNLPFQTTSFIGRRREIDEIKRLLGEARMVTLTGAGGTGKTRLSVQAASELTTEFKGGICLVELAALSDSAMVEREAALAMGLREDPGRAAIELIETFLRDRNLLVLLDNCEHLLEACARFSERLLKQCKGVRILATSREPVGIAGEYTYRVPTLQVPPPRYLPPPNQAREYEAVRLFLDRARFGNTGFEITEQNAPAVIHICQTLDGIPLAIELAAARAKSLPVEQIAARLDDCFRVVTGGNRTALPRHQTLRALIDWSYDLLPEPEKVLFRRLSVFAGGWTLEAAESICACSHLTEDRILDLLGSLTDRSLVVFDPEAGADRYRFLEPVRQYARAKLMDSGEEAIVSSAHQQWFLGRATSADLNVWGADGPEIMRRIDEDYDNMRAAMEYSRGLEDADSSLRFGSGLMHFWYARGYWGEGRDWLEDALRRSESLRSHARARALWAAAVMAWDLDECKVAEVRLAEVLSILEEIGDDPEASREHALLVLGTVKATQGKYEGARALLEQTRQLQAENGHDWNVSWTLYYQANVEFIAGNLETAARLAEVSLVRARAVGHRWAIPRSLNLIGILRVMAGDVDAGRAHAEEAIALQEVNGDRRGRVLSRLTLAYVYFREGKYREATDSAAESLRLFVDLNDRDGICLTLETIGRSA